MWRDGQAGALNSIVANTWAVNESNVLSEIRQEDYIE